MQIDATITIKATRFLEPHHISGDRLDNLVSGFDDALRAPIDAVAGILKTGMSDIVIETFDSECRPDAEAIEFQEKMEARESREAAKDAAADNDTDRFGSPQRGL